MGAEVGGQTPIAIVCTTANIRAESVPRPASRRGKPHMLVIWGEDPGLDMARDRTLLRQHEALFDSTDIGRHRTETIPDLKQRICDTIADPQGWRATLQRLLPTRRQAIALGLVVGLSLWPGVQQRLLAGRLLAQTIYHQLTLQLPQDEPPVNSAIAAAEHSQSYRSAVSGQPSGRPGATGSHGDWH